MVCLPTSNAMSKADGMSSIQAQTSNTSVPVVQRAGLLLHEVDLISDSNLEISFGSQSNSPFICETSQLQNWTQQWRTYLGESLCRWETLCTRVETLAKRRWLMSNGIAEGWMDPTSLGGVSVDQSNMGFYSRHLHWRPSRASPLLALHQNFVGRISCHPPRLAA